MQEIASEMRRWDKWSCGGTGGFPVGISLFLLRSEETNMSMFILKRGGVWAADIHGVK